MATRPLPVNPNLRSLKNQAKQLLHAHQSGNDDACQRIKASHPHLSGSPQEEIRTADFSLVDAQWVIAREYGFSSWPKLVATLKSPPGDGYLPPIRLTDLDLLPEKEQLQEILQLREFHEIDATLSSFITHSPKGGVRTARHQQKILPPNQPAFSFAPGENVKPAADRTGLFALHYGYICRQRDQIHVIPPLWIDGERMSVYFVHFSQEQPSQYPDLGEIKSLFAFMKIKHGIDEAALGQLIDRFQTGNHPSLLTPIAKGTQSQPGHDSRFEWAIETGKEHPNGGLPDSTFRLHREEAPLVNSGDLLGTLTGPERGLDGVDVFGHEVKAPTSHNVEVVSNARIRTVEGDEGQIRFFAKSGGAVYISSETQVIADQSRTRIGIGIYSIAEESH